MKDLLALFFGIRGKALGYGLIITVTFWDIFLKGARGFLEYGIHWRGIVLIWAGLMLIALSHWGDKRLK